MPYFQKLKFMDDKKQILMVKWIDSYGVTARWEDLSEYKAELLTCFTVGFKIYEDEDVICVASNYSAATVGTPDQVNGVMVIPKKSILAIEYWEISIK